MNNGDANNGDAMSGSGPVGYVVEWVTPAGDGRVKYAWFQRLGNAKNHAERLGKRGEGLKVRLLRTVDLEDITDELRDIYDPRAAEKWAEWASSAWRKGLLRHEPRWAERICDHRRAERALDWAEAHFSRAGRIAARERRTTP